MIMDPTPELTVLSYKALEELVDNFPPPKMGYGPVWEDITLPDGWEKPPKEAFEAKLQELIDAQPWKELREERDKRLTESDKFTAVDYPYATEGVRQAYLEYRQALRDLPENTEDPEVPTWPTLALPTEIDPMDILHRKRNEMLKRTDHLAFPDYPHLSEQVRADWMAYRQALRDLPQTATGDPANAAWPSEPTYE